MVIASPCSKDSNNIVNIQVGNQQTQDTPNIAAAKDRLERGASEFRNMPKLETVPSPAKKQPDQKQASIPAMIHKTKSNPAQADSFLHFPGHDQPFSHNAPTVAAPSTAPSMQ